MPGHCVGCAATRPGASQKPEVRSQKPEARRKGEGRSRSRKPEEVQRQHHNSGCSWHARRDLSGIPPGALRARGRSWRGDGATGSLRFVRLPETVWQRSAVPILPRISGQPLARVASTHRAVFTVPLAVAAPSATRLSSSLCRVDGTFLLYFSVSGSEVMSPAIIRFTFRAPPL